MKTAYIGLGSNIGDREKMLRDALDSLGPAVKRTSSVYESEPMYVTTQRAFLNMVVQIETELFPMMLLSRLQKIEQALGRKRSGPPNGPRTIDLDILFYGGSTVHTGRLEIPHPRLHERRFVLAPMAELAPDFRHPQLHKTMRELLAAVEGQKVRKSSLILRDPA